MASAAAILALSGALAGGRGQRVATLPCPGGHFVVSDAPIVTGDATPQNAALVIGAEHMDVGGSCLAAPVRLRRSKSGTTVSAHWSSCHDLPGQVRFRGTIDQTCTTLQGTLVAPSSHVRRAVRAQAVVTGRLHGALMQIAGYAIPHAERAQVRAARAQIEGEGFRVDAEGGLVVAPPAPAGGWLVRLGELQTLTDPDGTFTLDVPAGAPTQGDVFHPADTDTPIGQFQVTALAPEGETATPITFLFVSHGPCGMNADRSNEPPHCAAALGNRATTASQSFVPLDERMVEKGTPERNPPGPAQTTRALGTYPAGNQTVCLDYDGPLGGDHTSYRAYIFSTCHKRIREGCCNNEQADVFIVLLNKLYSSTRYPLIGCRMNHKGRLCQELTPDDLALEIAGLVRDDATGAVVLRDIVVKPSENAVAKIPGRAALTIPGGGTLDVTVHNNGCYGMTNVRRDSSVFVESNELHGTLSGAFLDHSPSDAPDVARLAHFELNDVRQPVYVPDRKIAYQAPSCPQDPDARDEFVFSVDEGFVEVSIAVSCQPAVSTSSTTSSTSMPPGTSTTTSSVSSTTLPFGITALDYQDTLCAGFTHEDFTISWSGHPRFPVLGIWQLQPGQVCPFPGPTSCAPGEMLFTDEANPLHWTTDVSCAETTATFPYELLLRDSNNVDTPAVATPFTCMGNCPPP